jgi:RNA polymerase sigma factor (sigma-70 family)
MSNIISRFREKDELLFIEVEKLKNGQVERFNTIYDMSKNYIYKIIWDIVKSQDAADDIMQETYLQIYNKVQGLADVTAFYSWAGRIATNFCLTYIKREKKYVLAEADESGDAEDFIFDRASDDHEAMIPESIVMNREQQKIIADILESLSTEQKLCVQYYYFEELFVKEIAEIMEVSEGTVKSRLNYARKSIKAAVETIERRDGTKLYSISALPLVFLIFREGADILFGGVAATAAGTAAAGAASGSASAAATVSGSAADVTVGVSGEIVPGTAGGVTNGAAGYAQGPVRGNTGGNLGDISKTAAKTVAKKMSIALKVFIATASTAVVVGGTLLIFNNKDDEKKTETPERLNIDYFETTEEIAYDDHEDIEEDDSTIVAESEDEESDAIYWPYIDGTPLTGEIPEEETSINDYEVQNDQAIVVGEWSQAEIEDAELIRLIVLKILAPVNGSCGYLDGAFELSFSNFSQNDQWFSSSSGRIRYLGERAEFIVNDEGLIDYLDVDEDPWAIMSIPYLDSMEKNIDGRTFSLKDDEYYYAIIDRDKNGNHCYVSIAKGHNDNYTIILKDPNQD